MNAPLKTYQRSAKLDVLYEEINMAAAAAQREPHDQVDSIVARFGNSAPDLRDLVSPEELNCVLETKDLSTFLTELAAAVPVSNRERDERLKRQILDGIRFKREMAELAGGLLSVSEVMAVLGYKTQQGVYKAVRERRILAVDDAGLTRFPACQFDTDGVIPGLRAVLEAAPTMPGWRILQYLLVPEDGLGGRRPIDLIAGSPDDLAIAVRFAKRLER